MEAPPASERPTGQNLHYLLLRSIQEEDNRDEHPQQPPRVANRERRESLRGVEEEIFDLLSEALTLDEWSEFLTAPLERAAAKGNGGLAQKLRLAGAAVGDALHHAVRGGHAGIVYEVLQGGASAADEDANGDTPLHVAARGGNTEMVELLILEGADGDATNESDCTPLYLAVRFGQVGAALALLAAGADIDLRCRHRQEWVVHLAARKGCVEILRAAMERGADVLAVDQLEYTTLHVAAVRNQVETIDVLVKAGANIEARTHFGGTPLFYAALHLHLDALLALVKHGAGVNTADMHGETPLHAAARMAGTRGAVQVVDSLLRSGADETLLSEEREVAADVVGVHSDEEEDSDDDDSDEEEDSSDAEDVEPVRKLLVNAPVDRAWRRRGYLVLCRAHPERVKLIQDSSRTSAPADLARKTCRGTMMAASGRTGTAGSSTAEDERTSGDWTGLVEMVLGLQEEDVFRTIIGFL